MGIGSPRHAPPAAGAGSTRRSCARSSWTPRRRSRRSSSGPSPKRRARSARTTAACCGRCAARGYRRVFTSDRGTADADALPAGAQQRRARRRRRPARPDRPSSTAARLGPAREAGGEAVALTDAKPRVALRPITDADVAGGRRVPARAPQRPTFPPHAWARALDLPWDVERPNSGFMLLEGERVVGANIAFYSSGRSTAASSGSAISARGASCEEHRFHSLRLVKALLAQDGYHFTDLSPSGNVVGRQREARLLRTWTRRRRSSRTCRGPRCRAASISAPTPRVIERTLSGRDLEIYRDHAATAAARQVAAAPR